MKFFGERVPLALKYIIICLTTQMQLFAVVLAFDESAEFAGLTQPTKRAGEHQNTQAAEPKDTDFLCFLKNATYQFSSEHYLGSDGSNPLTAYPWQRLTREATAANTTGFIRTTMIAPLSGAIRITTWASRTNALGVSSVVGK